MLMIAVAPGLHAEESKLTLDDRRYVETIKKETLPEAEKKLEATVGAPISIGIDWDSFQSREALKMLGEYSFKSLNEAVAEVARDEMGKKALADKIKEVRFVNTEDKEKKGVKIDGETLMVTWSYDSGSYVSPGMIEKALNAGL